jgi:ectoine hydroxylase-related dioxygenase (phytanoyl-CoA dioxygenase family)
VALQRFPPDVGADRVTEALDEHGYAVIEDLLTPDQVAAKRAELDRLLALTPTGRNTFEGFRTQRVYALLAKSRAFDDLALHPLVTGALDEVLEHYQLSTPVGVSVGPGEARQLLHHDDLVYPLPWPHQDVVVTCLWPLCDFSEANGATRLVPGSHRGDRDREPTPEQTVAVEMSAGSLLLYVGTTWHGGGANTTDQPRPAVLLEYVVSWLRAQETMLLAMPPEQARELPPALQELLGYNIFPPFLGYVDGRHPRRTLTRASEPA